MNILLINPQFPENYWDFRHALPFEEVQAVLPPLGLLTVSSLLPKDWERRVVDMQAGDKLTDQAIEWADMAFITGMLIQKEAVLETARRCKARGKTIVLGGPYVTTTHDDLAVADYIFLGEAEETLPRFIDDLARGQTQRIYQAEQRPQLSLTPMPDFSLIDLSKYGTMSVQYSRGCPFSCEFCDIIEIYGRVPRTKSNQQIIAELEAIRQLGWRGPLFIVDDNFIGNKKNIRLLLPKLIEWQKRHGRPFALTTEASINLADDPDLLTAMVEAGFTRVFIGIESPVEASLQETQKTQNRGNLQEKIAFIQSYGLEVMAGFIVGFDNDPDDIFDLLINFIQDSGIPLATVSLLSALPNTRLWRRMEREGRLFSEGVDNNILASMNFRPKMDPDKLAAGYRRVMGTIYSPRLYNKRSLECIRRMPPHSWYVARKYTPVKVVRGLCRIVVKLGLQDSDRKEFWRFMFLAVRQRRDRVLHALRLIVMGYHFKMFTRSVLDENVPLRTSVM